MNKSWLNRRYCDICEDMLCCDPPFANCTTEYDNKCRECLVLENVLGVRALKKLIAIVERKIQHHEDHFQHIQDD